MFISWTDRSVGGLGLCSSRPNPQMRNHALLPAHRLRSFPPPAVHSRRRSGRFRVRQRPGPRGRHGFDRSRNLRRRDATIYVRERRTVSATTRSIANTPPILFRSGRRRRVVSPLRSASISTSCRSAPDSAAHTPGALAWMSARMYPYAYNLSSMVLAVAFGQCRREPPPTRPLSIRRAATATCC